jgi:uncharacterized protein YdiU (UPF0061 family)
MRPSAYRWNLAALEALAPETRPSGPYSAFAQIDGTHPWKHAVPSGFIDYQARILRGSKVVYFNFVLAKEMGLIAKDHPHRLTKELEKTLVSTFALRIINEYDQLNGIRFPSKNVKANRYMATRYLQLQHADKTGSTSGDGRSIWNGQFLSAEGIVWDVSSCGTGVTRLSPGSVAEGKPVRTGDKNISYGSGLADIDEGLSAAILSESFHKRGIFTERTLLCLETPEGRGINVRAAKNLLRPSHLFLHLRQGNQLMLKRALDFYIAKEVHNGEISPPRDVDKYAVFLDKIARNYGEFAARLEDEYLFCWLDWDGDNMLLGGGIIDYGSIRQFGLCHHRYRYDDVDRFSTNLVEQRLKARRLVQTFVQVVDFVQTGRRRHFRVFGNNEVMKAFDETFARTRKVRLLERTGLSRELTQRCLNQRPELVEEFEQAYRFFERRESPRGLRPVPDGVNNPAIFCARSLLRELPRRLLSNGRELESGVFLSLMKTPYLTRMEMRSAVYPMAVARFQRAYLELLEFAYRGRPFRRALLETAMRASQNNRSDYATGDGIIHVVDFLLEKRRSLSRNEFIRLIDNFIRAQQGLPPLGKMRKETARLLKRLLEIVTEHRFTI